MTLICVRAVSGEDRRMPPIPAQEVDSGGEAEEAQLEVATVRAARAERGRNVVPCGTSQERPRLHDATLCAGGCVERVLFAYYLNDLPQAVEPLLPSSTALFSLGHQPLHLDLFGGGVTTIGEGTQSGSLVSG